MTVQGHLDDRAAHRPRRRHQRQGQGGREENSEVRDQTTTTEDSRAVAADLKTIYQSATMEEAEATLKKFDTVWARSIRRLSSSGV